MYSCYLWRKEWIISNDCNLSIYQNEPFTFNTFTCSCVGAPLRWWWGGEKHIFLNIWWQSSGRWWGVYNSSQWARRRSHPRGNQSKYVYSMHTHAHIHVITHTYIPSPPPPPVTTTSYSLALYNVVTVYIHMCVHMYNICTVPVVLNVQPLLQLRPTTRHTGCSPLLPGPSMQPSRRQGLPRQKQTVSWALVRIPGSRHVVWGGEVWAA